MAYPMETLEDARESRNRAWRDCVQRRISQAKLYALIAEIRTRHGQAIYERGAR